MAKKDQKKVKERPTGNKKPAANKTGQISFAVPIAVSSVLLAAAAVLYSISTNASNPNTAPTQAYPIKMPGYTVMGHVPRVEISPDSLFRGSRTLYHDINQTTNQPNQLT